MRLFVTFLIINFSLFAEASRVSVEAVGFTDAVRRNIEAKILGYAHVVDKVRGGNYRILETELHEENGTYPDYSVYIYNYSTNQMMQVTGPMTFLKDPEVRYISPDREASEDEYNEAIQLIKVHPYFAEAMSNGLLKSYDPMPSVILPEGSIGSFVRIPRIIAVGLNSLEQPDWNEIVGVDLAQGQVIRFPQRAPPTALAARAVCGIADAGQPTTRRGTSGSAEVEIRKDNEVLWKFTVVRPSASSGDKGSGLELRNVFYRGKKVLTRAHTPIINVQYINNRCGPFRDWGYSENYFMANGVDAAPGVRIASREPTTIFDTKQDRGNFRGVAIHDAGEKVTLVTEISAGWYRYASKFELHDDGTLRPYFQFSAVSNTCVCYSHNHHVYWRLDFDVDGTNNFVEIPSGNTFKVLKKEATLKRSSANREWRVLNSKKTFGYVIKPGPDDGVADSFSISDIWFVKYYSTQLDDREEKTSAKAALNSFVTGESVMNANIVMWYSGHFMHNHDEDESDSATVGPTIQPMNNQID